MSTRSIVRILGAVAVGLFSVLGIVLLLARALPLSGIMFGLAVISFCLLKAISLLIGKTELPTTPIEGATSMRSPIASGKKEKRPLPLFWIATSTLSIAGFAAFMLIRENAPEWTWPAVALTALGLLAAAVLRNRKLNPDAVKDIMSKAGKPSTNPLANELLSKTAEATRKLDGIADSIVEPRLRKLADALVMHSIVFLRQAKSNPALVVKQQRFATYYLPQAVSILERCEKMARHPSAHKEEMPKIETALQELGPVFAHFSAAISRDEAVDMDVELRLLRSSIREDMLAPPPK